MTGLACSGLQSGQMISHTTDRLVVPVDRKPLHRLDPAPGCPPSDSKRGQRAPGLRVGRVSEGETSRQRLILQPLGRINFISGYSMFRPFSLPALLLWPHYYYF